MNEQANKLTFEWVNKAMTNQWTNEQNEKLNEWLN